MSLDHWTINEIPAAELGIVNIKLDYRGLATSTATLTLDTAQYDADLPDVFAPYNWLSIRAGGQRVFHGLVLGLPRSGANAAETVTVSVVDAWHVFERVTYEAERAFCTAPDAPDDPPPEITFQPSAHVMLGADARGEPEGAAAILSRALALAIGRYGLNLQIGRLLDGVVLANERNSLTIAEAIRMALQYTPDALAWIDYATEPPTFHAARRAGADALTLAVHDGLAVTGNVINPRYDLLYTGVRIVYEYTERKTSRTVKVTQEPVAAPGINLPGNLDDINVARVTTRRDYTIKPIIDTAGTGAADNWRNIVFAVELDGGEEGEPGTPAIPQSTNVNFNEYHVERENVDINSAEFWQSMGAIPDGASGVKIENVRAVPDGRVHHKLVSGSFPPGLESYGFQATVTCEASYQLYNDSGAGKTIEKSPLKVTFTATDSAQDDFAIPSYTVNAAVDEVEAIPGVDPEQPPPGLAAQLLEAYRELQYDAELTLTEREADPSRFHVGQALSLGGGRAEWAGARMQVQSVSVDAATGVTRVVCGPTPLLDAATLVDLLRGPRSRSVAGLAERAEAAKPEPYVQVVTHGGVGGGKTKAGPTKTNQQSGSGAETFSTKQVMAGGGETKGVITLDAGEHNIELKNKAGSKTVIINLGDLDEGGEITVRLRAVEVCVGGVPKHVYLLMSDPLDSD